MKDTIQYNLIILLLLVCAALTGFSQTINTRYLIKFKDRANTPYSLAAPSVYLSPRALQRRANQNITVKTNDLPVNPSYIDSVTATGAKVLYATRWLNGVVVKIDTANATTTLNKIKNLPFVVGSTQVKRRISGTPAPYQPKSFLKTESALNISADDHDRRVSNDSSYYGLAYNQIHMLNGEMLHDRGFKGKGMVIAVLDAGFNSADVLPAFDSLWANNQILGVKDFVGFNDKGVFQDDAHGMEVLSTMGGNIPGHLVGTAPKASFWLLRSEDGSSEYIIEEVNYVRAAEFADSVGADIIHSSLGYTTFDDPTENHTYKDMNGHTAYCSIGAGVAASKGILVTCSAGNEGGPIGSTWHYISAPADGDSVLTVGATYSDGTVTGFSSRGPTSDGRVKPVVMAQGKNAAIENTDGMVHSNGSGTSFSGPIIAGMVASYWSSVKNLTNMQVYDYIQRSASLYPAHNDSMGYGIPDFNKAYLLATGASLVPMVKKPFAVIMKNKSINEGLAFYINSDTIQKAEVDFYSLAGKKVYSIGVTLQQGQNQELSITDLPLFTRGMYIVQLILPEKQLTYTYKSIKY